MLAPSLTLLLKLQARGVVRQTLRRARTLRGAMMFAVGLIVFAGWLLPTLLTAHLQKPDPQSVRVVMPLFILGVALATTLSSAGEKAIAFTGGETDMLFPGPYSRRQLVIYKLVKGTGVAFLTALIISVAIYRNATLWLACYVGSALALLFVQYAGSAALLAGEAVGRRWRNVGRVVAILAILGLLALALRSAGGEGWLEGLVTDPLPILLRAAEQPAGKVLLAPFRVLTNAITAERLWPDLPIWGGIALGMNVLLGAVIILLDQYFVEAAAGASERRYERIRRFKSGGALTMTAKSTARRSLPMFPRYAGAGTIAWRQMVHATRAGRMVVLMLLLLMLAIGPMLFAGARSRDPGNVMAVVIGVMAWMSILLAAVLRFDFRADLDVIETLKSLPLTPNAIAAGQLIAPTVVMTMLHWSVVVATLIVAHYVPAVASMQSPLMAAAAVAPAFNLLMFSAENLIFLLAPTRPMGAGPGDFALLGRQILTLAIRTVAVSLGAAVALGAGVAAYYVVGESVVAAIVMANIVLLVESAGMIPLIGLAFSRFDPSKHMPG